ncbi:FtsW/RodA/SpoVE family cell cycle protein, partial [Lactiplantibacillus plantarum]
VVNTILKEADLFCPNSVRINFTIYHVSTGVAVMLAFHMFENIGMTIGLLPLTGIPLPFVSQGGSAIIGDFMGVGLVLATQYPNVRSIFSVPRIFH